MNEEKLMWQDVWQESNEVEETCADEFDFDLICKEIDQMEIDVPF